MGVRGKNIRMVNAILPRPFTLMRTHARALRVDPATLHAAEKRFTSGCPIQAGVDLLTSHAQYPADRFDSVQRYFRLLRADGQVVNGAHAVAPNQLEDYALRSTHYAVRHSTSVPNERGVVCSVPEYALAEAAGLSSAGIALANRNFSKWWAEAGLSAANVILISSDYSRALQTAQIAAVCWGIPLDSIITSRAIRERAFGPALEGLRGRVVYPQVWEHDSRNATSHSMVIDGCGQVGVESAASVQYRASSVVREVDTMLDAGKHVFWFGHGDTLQIMVTAFAGLDASLHRRGVPHLENAEIRQLVHVQR